MMEPDAKAGSLFQKTNDVQNVPKCVVFYSPLNRRSMGTFDVMLICNIAAILNSVKQMGHLYLLKPGFLHNVAKHRCI